MVISSHGKCTLCRNFCQLPHNEPERYTASGQAWTECEIDPPAIWGYHGTDLRDAYGNKTIRVTVKGFTVKEPLCWHYDGSEKPSGVMKCQGDGGEVFLVVISRFTIATKHEVYTEEEEKEYLATQRKLVTYLDESIRRPREGETKFQEFHVSPVSYEFPKK